MKRTLILIAFLGFLAPVAFVGCSDTTEVKKTEVIKTPEGSKTLESIQRETDTPKKP